MSELELRNEPKVVMVGDTLKDIEYGKYIVPEFQRDYSWGKNEVLALLHSMVRNFIIGNITVFNSENKWHVGKDRYNFPVNDNANPRYIVLDGQQRTTTLYSLRIGHKLSGMDFGNFKLDLTVSPRSYGEVNPFVYTNRVRKNLIPLNHIIGENYYFQDVVDQFEILIDHREANMIVEDIRNSILNYRLSLSILSASNGKATYYDEHNYARKQFVQINKSGKSLSIPAQILPMWTDPNNNFYAKNVVNDIISKEINPDFGITIDVLIRIVGTCIAESILLDDMSQAPILDVTQFLNKNENGIEIVSVINKAIDFFDSRMNIKRLKDLPTNIYFYFVTYYFYKTKTNNMRQKDLLEKMCWEYIFAGTSCSPLRLKTYLKIVDSIINDTFNMQNSVMSYEDFKNNSISGNVLSSKKTKSYINILLARHPRSLITGNFIKTSSNDKNLKFHKDHLFPKSTNKNEYIESAINISICDAETNLKKGNLPLLDIINGYTSKLINSKEVLISQFIDIDCYKAIKDGDFELFIEKRCKLIFDFYNQKRMF